MTKALDLESLSDVFLKCRTVGHAWEPRVTYVQTVGRRVVHSATWYCDREERAGVPDPTEKDVVTVATGKQQGQPLQAPVYAWPDGYLLELGTGRGPSNRPAARVELMGRLVKSSGPVAEGDLIPIRKKKRKISG